MDQQARTCLWERWFPPEPLCHPCQPIKETRIGLAGQSIFSVRTFFSTIAADSLSHPWRFKYPRNVTILGGYYTEIADWTNLPCKTQGNVGSWVTNHLLVVRCHSMRSHVQTRSDECSKERPTSSLQCRTPVTSNFSQCSTQIFACYDWRSWNRDQEWRGSSKTIKARAWMYFWFRNPLPPELLAATPTNDRKWHGPFSKLTYVDRKLSNSLHQYILCNLLGLVAIGNWKVNSQIVLFTYSLHLSYFQTNSEST